MYYPTVYSDDRGIENCIMYNDGKSLTVHIRDVTFLGCDFDSLEPVDYDSKESLESFTLKNDMLCNCGIECLIPLIVTDGIQDSFGTLEILLELGKPNDRNAIDKEDLYLKFRFNGKIYSTDHVFDDFESGLLSIGQLLPDPLFLKCCFTCLFSDYSPYGMGLFGSLACFRDKKDEYLNLGEDGDIKGDLLNIWDEMTEYVQEIHLCNQYRKRIPYTGYRG